MTEDIINESVDTPVESHIYYAVSTGGFYNSNLHTSIPEDAIEITPELHTALIEGQCTGKHIAPPDDNHPQPWLADPLPPTFTEVMEIKLTEVMSGYDATFSTINAIYPAIEREGWAKQEAEALAVLADPNTVTPILSTLIQRRNRGETVTELAEKVLKKSAQWGLIYADLTGQQQRMYAEVIALTEIEDILAYEVTYTMPES